ncbi:tetratricopeptide repeat protein [Anaeromyxobacter sp. SG66]|uniref:tetratricopeptide repeat protein n=1 Tax=Anaeromyxobacter sp. SG66 TaxID=2925410 RepID=UPI001F575E12|nr:tetratricopeptide repeat protein [Anaeromyxobacter sp. SG66]
MNPLARRGGTHEVEGLDEEFLFHLSRGTELIGAGDADGARAALERARTLRPKDVKVLGLLGQAYYRLGRFEDAGDVWQVLVDESPVEPAARVNLGLARLKAKRHADAARQLQIALDLNPDHRKAMGYLGLALLEGGDPAAARAWFERTGAEHMIARCDALLAGPAGAEEEAAPPVAVADEGAPGEPLPAEQLEPLATPVPVADLAAEAPLSGSDAFDAASAALAAEDERAAPPAPIAQASPPALSAWAASRVLALEGAAPFAVQDGVLAVAVRGELRVRLEGLFAIRGQVALAGDVKRFRGRVTETPFGQGAARMYHASGDGVLLLRAGDRRLTALELGGEAAYFREDAVCGLDAGLAFENGRVPSSAGELNLVHIRGQGALLVASRGEPVAIDVVPGTPVRLPLTALVGWTGALTPRLGPLADEAEGAPLAVELTGEGRALADPEAVAEGGGGGTP